MMTTAPTVRAADGMIVATTAAAHARIATATAALLADPVAREAPAPSAPTDAMIAATAAAAHAATNRLPALIPYSPAGKSPSARAAATPW